MRKNNLTDANKLARPLRKGAGERKDVIGMARRQQVFLSNYAHLNF